MNLDEVGLLIVVALAIAVVEGIKQAYESLSGKELPSGAKVIASVGVGTILASVAEFAPGMWVRVIPILTAGLAAAGLYSISKRAGIGAGNAVQATRVTGSPDAFTTLVNMSDDELDANEDWADFLNSMEPDYGPGGKPGDESKEWPVEGTDDYGVPA